MRWQGKPPGDPFWQEKWHRWFAWRPVKTIRHQWVWLENVQRRHIPDPQGFGFGHNEYL